MRLATFRVTFFTAFLFPLTASADPNPLSSGSSKADSFREVVVVPTTRGPVNLVDLLNSVVKIKSVRADFFTAQMTGDGHGTGFYVGDDVDTGKALIFTNNHVISRGPFEVQKLEVEVRAPSRRNESVPAEVLFMSRIHDFAVLEVDKSALRRTQLARPLELPDMDSPFRDPISNMDALINQNVVSMGNPLSTDWVVTPGTISGLLRDPGYGPLIQHRASVNFGNSGGPLIELGRGMVVGLNTLKVGQDGTGLAHPIAVLMDEFVLWKHQVRRGQSPSAPTMVHPRKPGFELEVKTEEEIKLQQLDGLIETAIPGFWMDHESVLVVRSANASTSLKVGDVLLTIDGEVIGGMQYDFNRLVRRTGTVVRMSVLRDRKVVKLEVPMPGAAFEAQRIAVDFAMISGLLMQDLPKGRETALSPGMTSRAAIVRLMDTPLARLKPGLFPPIGSLVTGIEFVHVAEGQDPKSARYTIRNVYDLKAALNENRGAKVVIFTAHPAATNQEPNLTIAHPFVDGRPRTYTIPMDFSLTPAEFSISDFVAQFDFDNPDTWDFRKAIKSRCRVVLSGGPL